MISREIQQHLSDAQEAINRSDEAGANEQETRELRTALRALIQAVGLLSPIENGNGEARRSNNVKRIEVMSGSWVSAEDYDALFDAATQLDETIDRELSEKHWGGMGGPETRRITAGIKSHLTTAQVRLRKVLE